MTITLKQAQDRIEQEWVRVHNLFAKYGYEYHARFTEEPDIQIWAPKNGEFEEGRYNNCLPGFGIDSQFDWTYDDEENNLEDGNGADELEAFLSNGDFLEVVDPAASSYLDPEREK